MRWWLGIVVGLACACTSRARPHESTTARADSLGAAGAGNDEPVYVWQRRIPRPDAHSRQMVYDRARQRTFMWDAHHDGTRFVTSMWEWNGGLGTWAQRPESSEVLRNDDGFFSAGGAWTYDTTRSKMVLTDSLNGFWEWDGALGTWTLRGQPDPRLHWAFGMIYDAERELFVIVSTESGVQQNVHVFEWDPADATFSERALTNGWPPPRGSGAVGWDAARRRVVLFGGRASTIGTTLSDLWEWDPTTGAWEERHPTRPGPRARSTEAVAYHDARAHIFIFGGTDPVYDSENPDAPMNDLWEWDGTAGEWIAHPFASSSAVPVGGSKYSLVYDSMRQKLELFGSTFAVSESGGGGFEVFDWDDTAQLWIDYRPPTGRQYASAAYDPASERVVLFGGEANAVGSLNDVWAYDAASEVWRPRSIPEPRPSARYQAPFVADERRETLLVFRGTSGSVLPGTWELDAVAGTWTNRSAASGEPDIGSATATYDSNRGKVLLFGGQSGRPELNDLWEWDGDAGTWTMLSVPEPKPAPRTHAFVAFDAARNRLVMFGGYSSIQTKSFDDTWEWNPSDGTWARRLPEGSFGLQKALIGLFYDAARERVVMFGGEPASGSGGLRDVWEWDGEVGNWGHVSITGDSVPATRNSPAFAFDPVRRVLVMFSGFSSVERTDHWELSVSCPAPATDCVTTPPPPDAGTGTGGTAGGGADSGAAASGTGGASGTSSGGNSARGGDGNDAGSGEAGDDGSGEGGEEVTPERSSDKESGCGCHVHARRSRRALLLVPVLAAMLLRRRRLCGRCAPLFVVAFFALACDGDSAASDESRGTGGSSAGAQSGSGPTGGNAGTGTGGANSGAGGSGSPSGGSSASAGAAGNAGSSTGGASGGGGGPSCMLGTPDVSGITSCRGSSANCGPDGTKSCCDSELVPGGTFNRSDDERYPATVSDFRLDTYEMTVGRFKNFLSCYPTNWPRAGSGRNSNNVADRGWDAAWDAELPADRAALETALDCSSNSTWEQSDDRLPMNCISWFVANAFCIWDGGRLPTDAEAAYAAFGGNEQRYHPWSVPPSDQTIDDEHAVRALPLLPVGSKSPLGDGRWGHADLAGNVSGWVLDYGITMYPLPCVDCANFEVPSDGHRIHVGSWRGTYADFANDAARFEASPRLTDPGIGVRCARAP